MTAFHHITVMRDEVLAAMHPADGEVHVDCTLGGGGHAEALLNAANCRVIGLDRDPSALAASAERLAPFGDRFTPVRAKFSAIGKVLDGLGIATVDGILADLGVSSPQLDDPARGFSFRTSGPVDMRMDPDADESAARLVNEAAESDLADILFKFGDEKRSRAVAKAIVAGRPWTDTLALADAIAGAVGRREAHRIHPATRSFQALRIATNDELGELDRLLAQIPDRLKPCGRVAIVTFHSLEDRAVKRALQREAARGTERDPYGNPVNPPRLSSPASSTPDDPTNPRARSARLRSASRLPCPTP
jgi:16S rRNA (cytosine1402-N4)-methyltransferase